MNQSHWFRFGMILGTIICWGLASSSFAKTLELATKSDPKTIIPWKQQPGEDHYLRNLVTPPLVALSPQWKWVCFICAELPTAEKDTLTIEEAKNGRQRLITEWEIPKQFSWANGRPVTGYDVQYTVSKIKKGMSDHIARRSYPIEAIEVDRSNPRKFKVIFQQVRSDFAQFLAISLLPSYLKQLNTKAEETLKAGQKASLIDENNFDPKEDYFYYGPYRVTNIQGRKVEFERNPGFPKSAGNIDKIIAYNVDSAGDALYQVQRGNIQMVHEGLLSANELFAWQNKLEKEQGLKDKFRLIKSEQLVLEQLLINTRNPMMSDTSVRQALLYAIDRDRLNEQVFHAFAFKADHLLNKRDALFSTAIRTYDYNPKKAEKLLSEAGWDLEGSQKVRSKDGQKLSITISTTDDPIRRAMAEGIRRDWEKVGAEVKVDTQSTDTFFSQTLPKVKFRDMALLAQVQAPGAPYWTVFHAKEIPTQSNDYHGGNIVGWYKNEVNETLDKMSVALDDQELKKLTANLMKHYVLDLPSLPLFFTPTGAVILKDMKNFVIPGHTYSSSLYARDWQIP